MLDQVSEEFWNGHVVYAENYITPIFIGTENNFEKASPATTTAFGVGYDYGSVMHYSANAFSRNGQPTIIAKVSQFFLTTACALESFILIG